MARFHAELYLPSFHTQRLQLIDQRLQNFPAVPVSCAGAAGAEWLHRAKVSFRNGN